MMSFIEVFFPPSIFVFAAFLLYHNIKDYNAGDRTTSMRLAIAVDVFSAAYFGAVIVFLLLGLR